MKKKVLSVMLASAMVASLAVGCGSGAPASTQAAGDQAGAGSTASVPASGENELSVYAWDANFNIPALQAAEADYKANVNPDFKLNIVEQPNSDAVRDAIRNGAESGDFSQLPDIVLFQDHQFQGFVTSYPDAWQPLTGDKVDWSDFGAEKLSYSTTADGTHYGFPVDNGTVICAYRTDLLAEAGYTIDDLTGCTWEKFIEIGEAVYAKTNKYLVSMDGSGNDMFYMMLQAEGVSQFKNGEPNLEDPTVKEITAILAEMVQKNVLYLANDWGDYTDNTIMGDMVAGVINGNWIIPTIQQVEANSGKWEITTMPTIKGGDGYAANGGSALYITANCKNHDLAEDFLSYTFGGSSATYDEALLKGGVITTCISAGKSDVYNQGVAFFNDQAIYSIIVEYGSHVKIIEQNDFHYTCREKMGTALSAVVAGTSVDDALATANADLRFAMELN